MLSTYRDSQANASRLEKQDSPKNLTQQLYQKKKRLSVDTKTNQLAPVPSTSTMKDPPSPGAKASTQKHQNLKAKLNFALPGGPDINNAKLKDDEHSLYLGKGSATPNSLSGTQRRQQLLDQEGGDPVKDYEEDIARERAKYEQQAKLRSDAIAKRKQSNNT